MQSVWSKNSSLPRFEPLGENKKTDVLIIGGGIAGILCAHLLTQAGVDCVVAEASTVCSGITKNTTAKITVQHGLFCDKLLRRFGTEKAQMYLQANQAALEKYRALSSRFDCDFEEKDSFVFSRSDRKALEREVTALQKIGCASQLCEATALPFPTVGAVRLADQAQFHPLKLLAAIAPQCRIYEHTPVRELRSNTAITPHGTITAKKIIVATHFPFINKHGSYFLKMYQHRSYVIALKNAADVGGMYVEDADKGMSFRNYKDLLLIGGGDHRTGKQGGNWDELSQFAAHCYPQAKEQYRWAAQDCMTLDGVPYIGQYSARTHDLYVATGFNKWGMTSAMTAAMLLADLVTGKENPYAPVFSPSRSILRPQLAVNGAQAVMGWLSFTQKRCPHLGCALKWNPQEHSWDCPCHGSRFTESGRLIDNPATGDLKKRPR